MPRNEEGEIELTVGNKQLLSIVFVLFVLFGVVFSMGYFFGRANSSGDATPVAARPPDSATPAGRPAAAGPEAPPQTPAGAPSQPAAEPPLEPGEGRVTGPEGPPTAQPAASTAPSSPRASPATPAAGQPPAPPKPAPAPIGAAPQPGQTFLQVAAIKREQAQILADVLKDKGYRAVLVPITVDGQQLYRTLVGPLRDASETAKTKADLESAGFRPILKKF